MDAPIVSVVIPLYNKAPHIARALTSVLKQTFQDFEVIVVDDGSTDDGAEIVRRFEDPRIRLIQQENRGVSAARNRGIEEARAELIAFLDADDEWLPDFLSTIIRMYNKFPDGGAYATSYFTTYGHALLSPKIYKIPPSPWEGAIPNFFISASEGEIITSSSVVIPRDVFNYLGLFKSGEHYGEDTEMWGRIALEYDIVFSWYRGAIIHYEAINRAANKKGIIQKHPFVDTGMRYINNTSYPRKYSVTDIKEYMEIQQMKIACRAFKSGDMKFGREILKRCDTTKHQIERVRLLIISFFPLCLYNILRNAKYKIKTWP